ncbi:hypothetical protein [Streptomyces ipomoeae]|uniref:hypothetical protein n=1 Tax=Streptomyces ipomoeae TaxID=103232 RepID=UPI0011462AB3|nr:hypothetical protein [Streptomyces ipomoeae]TQE33129.1 hypothetical protein Sipo7851_21785 [Streptomyces ipomoeae]
MPEPLLTPPPPDLVDFDTGAAFLARSGHPVSASTLRRAVRQEQVKIWRRGRRHLVSLSDLLVLHGQRVEDE